MEDKNKKGAGRPAEPKLVNITARNITFTRNVRFRQLWDSPNYSTTDISLYGDAIPTMWDSIKDEVENGNKLFRFHQTPIVVEMEDGTYDVQDGKTRCLTMLTYAPDKQFVVEVRGKGLSADEQMEANTIRTEMTDMAIAFTIKDTPAKKRKAAILRAGWTEKKAGMWLHIIDKLDKRFFVMIAQNRMSIDVAVDMANQSEKTQSFLAEIYTTEGCTDVMESVSRALLGQTAWSERFGDSDPRIEYGILYEPYVFTYSDGMVNTYYMTAGYRENTMKWKAKYDMWYINYKRTVCGNFNLDYKNIEDHDGYKGGYHSEENKVELLPYDGKGKAWWNNHRLVYVVTDKIADIEAKVQVKRKKLTTVDASAYAYGKVMKQAASMINPTTIDIEQLAKLMAIQMWASYESPAQVVAQYLRQNSTNLREGVVKELIGSRYDELLEQFANEYMEDKTAAVKTEEDKIAAACRASVSIAMPMFTVGKANSSTMEVAQVRCWLQWLDDDIVSQVKALDGRYYDSIKQHAKAMGVSVSMGKLLEAEVLRIQKVVKRIMKDNAEQWSYEIGTIKQEYLQWWNEQKNEVDALVTIIQEMFAKTTGYDAVITNTSRWTCENRLIPAFEKYLAEYYHRAVKLAFTKMDKNYIIAATPEDAADGVVPIENVVARMHEFLYLRGYSISMQKVEVAPVVPMQEKKEVVANHDEEEFYGEDFDDEMDYEDDGDYEEDYEEGEDE